MLELEKFIVTAKANGWVGAAPGGKKIESSRRGSYDIVFEQGDFFYQDSFVGLSDFCGQEHICYKAEPVWSMSYYGYLLHPEIFDGPGVVRVLKAALSALYSEGRFLGNFKFTDGDCEYHDSNSGGHDRFSGHERILQNERLVYELRYVGGMVRK